MSAPQFNPNQQGDIEFHNVSFSYPKRNDLALNDLTLLYLKEKLQLLLEHPVQVKSTIVKLT